MYEDLHNLYDKTIPVVAVVQQEMQKCSDQIKTFELVISKFDENLQLRSLKTETAEFLIQLRTYVKDRVFKETITDIENTLSTNCENIKTLFD